jgi:hypothetical protein
VPQGLNTEPVGVERIHTVMRSGDIYDVVRALRRNGNIRHIQGLSVDPAVDWQTEERAKIPGTDIARREHSLAGIEAVT